MTCQHRLVYHRPRPSTHLRLICELETPFAQAFSVLELSKAGFATGVAWLFNRSGTVVRVDTSAEYKAVQQQQHTELSPMALSQHCSRGKSACSATSRMHRDG